jgi:hypothetical protein
MSAPKSRARKQKLARKRRRKQEARQRRKKRGCGSREDYFPVGTLVSGGLKMSDVLQDFMKPFLDEAEGEDALRRLFTIGMVAWNAALSPEPQRQELLDDVLSEGSAGLSPEMQAVGRQFINQLIERKERYFDQYRRPILDFVLTDIGDGYHLSVVSAVV